MEEKRIKDFYIQENIDESVVDLIDANGFTVIRKYKSKKAQGLRLLIRLFLSETHLFCEVSMVKKFEGIDIFGESYSHIDYENMPIKVTNFSVRKNDFTFINGVVEYKNSNCFFNLNQIVNILECNHFRKRLIIKRKIHNMFFKIILIIIFFLADKKYHYKTAIKEIVVSELMNRDKEIKIEKVEVSEPFLNYFKIYKNQLLTTACFFVFWFIIEYLFCSRISFYKIDATNIFVLSTAFLILFLLEKTSSYISSLFLKNDNEHSRVSIFINKIDKYKINLKIK